MALAHAEHDESAEAARVRRPAVRGCVYDGHLGVEAAHRLDEARGWARVQTERDRNRVQLFVVDANKNIINADLHVNGKHEVKMTNGTWNATTRTCANTGCHGTKSW